MRFALSTVLVVAALVCGCDDPDAAEVDADDEDAFVDPIEARYFKGVNGEVCAASKYNCKLRPKGGNRVATDDKDDNDSWAIAQGVPVRDGNGTIVAYNDKMRGTFNWGQMRSFDGADHVLGLSTTNGSSGWMPLSAIAGQTSFKNKLGKVSAVGEGLKKLGCYAIRDSHNAGIEFKKVVRGSKVSHERAGDYLPLVRKNGKRSANLIFNVPGFALGGVTVDHFPAGTKFQRYDVPTGEDGSGPASIDIPLYIKDGNGEYKKPDGTMKFIYGYVIAATGTKRNGWMAYEALEVSSNCP